MNERRRPRAVLDADIIFSRVLHELMGRIAAELRLLDLFWSEQLLAEAQRSLVEKKQISAESARRWVDYLRLGFPAGRIDLNPHIPDVTALTRDPGDAHVCALVVAARADYLFTVLWRGVSGILRRSARRKTCRAGIQSRCVSRLWSSRGRARGSLSSPRRSGWSEATIYNWLKQEQIDRGEAPGLSTEGQMELAAAKRRIRQLETELAVSRKVNEVFLEGDLSPKRLYPVIESLAGQGFDVQRACVMLEVSASGYYAWKDRPPSQRTLRHAWLAGEIAQVHKDSAGTYGSRRMTAELRYGRGITVGHNQVELIMRRLGLHGLPKRRLPRGAKLGKTSSLDLVRRRFRSDAPDRLWMTDIERHEALWTVR